MIMYEKITTEEDIRIVTGLEAYMVRTVFSDTLNLDLIMMIEKDLQVLICGNDMVAYRFKVNPRSKPHFVDDFDLAIKSGKLVMYYDDN